MTQVKKSVENNDTNNNNVSVDASIQETVKTSTLGLDIPKEEKDLLKDDLIAFLNQYDVEIPDWKEKKIASFNAVLDATILVSPELCELYSLGLYLEGKGIYLIKPDKKIFSFKEVLELAPKLLDTKEAKTVGFPVGRVKYFKEFKETYRKVFIEISKGVKQKKEFKSIEGKEGAQILAFLTHLNTLGYSYKAKPVRKAKK